ncbi:hypothetical protein [Sphingomonas sp. Leaf10]|uniref:hypothetical protein n=1 Tax=Sphingomonas sp. Leaf10 TaxID=1735676 RepID=UPI0006F72399|nr:hypothetical protein [Sphingomonas sp. Leaf10]KQM37642.1 hypothetical protein ASE59_14260 [Sphingomonas sp. Leaf10]
MTPTNDAPVTVEQLEMQAHRLDRIREDNDKPTLTDQAVLRETADMLRRLAALASAPAGKLNRDFTARRIKELMDEGDGFWTACSGCQESCDGYVSERDYPFDPIFRCQPGGGCSECGGIGVLWDDGRGYDDITGDAEPASAPAGDGVEAECDKRLVIVTDDFDRGWNAALSSIRDHFAGSTTGQGVEAMRAALERSREGWSNAIEFGIIPPQHRNAAKILADECTAALARPRAAVGSVKVERVETVPLLHPFDDSETPPIWRIVIDGYCADFEVEQAARNFAAAIERMNGPRAAVGQRNDLIEIVTESIHHYVADDAGTARDCAAHAVTRILALQSPPAKVEG